MRRDIPVAPFSSIVRRNLLHQIWFKSLLFSVEPNEDKETNPFVYGKQLAEWLKARFSNLGYEVGDLISEDWGWCVMLQRDPYMLWVGCSNVMPEELLELSPEEWESYVPAFDDLTWSALVGTDVPIWTSFFWKRLIGKANTESDEARVAKQLDRLIGDEPQITVVEEP